MLFFLTGFTRQNKQFEKIIKEHWPLLLKDRDLSSVLPAWPEFIYTKKLTRNVVNPPKKSCTYWTRQVFLVVVNVWFVEPLDIGSERPHISLLFIRAEPMRLKNVLLVIPCDLPSVLPLRASIRG